MSTAADRKRWYRPVAEHWRQNPITYCEVRFEGCFGTYGLSPAHSRDRRDIETPEQMAEVVAACGKCHTQLDHKMAKDEREQKVKQVIADRDEYIQMQIEQERLQDEADFFTALYD